MDNGQREKNMMKLYNHLQGNIQYLGIRRSIRTILSVVGYYFFVYTIGSGIISSIFKISIFINSLLTLLSIIQLLNLKRIYRKILSEK